MQLKRKIGSLKSALNGMIIIKNLKHIQTAYQLY